MTPRHCSRCGRRQPDERELPEPTGAWTSIDGADVCPDCQTAVERRDTQRRVIDAIEAEIERRRREGIPPDEVESALVAYALRLREELEGAVPEPALRQRLRVAMTAAFLTGHPLAVRITRYGELQTALDSALTGHGWQVHDLHEKDGTYASGGGFVEALPLVIARREDPELVAQLRYRLEDPDETQLATLAPGYELEPDRLSIDVYDLGVAVLTAWFEVSAPGHDLPLIARTIRRLAWQRPGNDGRSPIAHALQQIARDTADRYGAAVRTVPREAVERSWLSGRWAADLPTPDHGRLLWLHPVHVLEDLSPREDTTKRLAPTFHQTIELADGFFAPGIGWSAIVTEPGSGAHRKPVELTRLHWAYYALYMELDRGLLAILNQSRWSASGALKDLDGEADDVFRDYLRVMEARARLDSALSALGGDELAIWEKIAAVQRFETIVAGVERKIDVLQRLTERRVAQATATRARRFNAALGSLSALTVLSVAFALFGYLIGTRSDEIGNVWLRVAVFVLASLLAVLLVVAAYREAPWRLTPRFRRRP